VQFQPRHSPIIEWSKARERLSEIANQPKITNRDLCEANRLVHDQNMLDKTALWRMVDRHCPKNWRNVQDLCDIPPEHRREFVLLARDAPFDPKTERGELALIIEQSDARDITDHEIERTAWLVRALLPRKIVLELIRVHAGPRIAKHAPAERDITPDRRPGYVAALLRMTDR
jgi:hypothetical protein